METKNKKCYSLGENTEIFFNGESEIVIRTGVWNYEDAILDISVFDEDMQEKVLDLFRTISEGKKVSEDELTGRFEMDSENADQVQSVLDELAEQAYLSNGYEDRVGQLITRMIGGTASKGMSGNVSSSARTLLICDCDAVADQLWSMSSQMSMSMDIMTEEDINKVCRARLTDRLDALETEKQFEELSTMFVAYSSVLICLQRPHIMLLRNLNRILLRMSIPFVVCLADGPFLSVMTIKGYETGCFECYETRVMARLESMSAYRNYVEKTSGNLRKSSENSLTPILGMIASLGLYDAFLINTIHKAKLAGRVFNIYLPTLEVQVEDLLRVPFCSACGHIAKAEYEEMYSSSEEIVEQLVANVEISADGE